MKLEGGFHMLDSHTVQLYTRRDGGTVDKMTFGLYVR